MSLLGKEPVQNSCEAKTFEEAAAKNRLRLSHERDQAKDLYEEMKRDKDPFAETMNHEFWIGALAANEQAFRIYQEEQAAFHKRVVERISITLLLLNPPKPSGDAWKSGWKDIGRNWVKAFEKNDPSIIVYW